MRCQRLILVGSIILLIAGAAVSQNIDHVNSLLWNDINDIKIRGNTAFCLFRAGMVILDISEPASPIVLSKTYIQGGEHGFGDYRLQIDTDYAYVASGRAGLQVFDISDPANPGFVGSLVTPTPTFGIAIMDNYAVMMGTGGIYLVDITIPSSPRLESRLEPLGGEAVAVSDHYAYVAASSSGMRVYDLHNPQAIQIIASYPESGQIYNLTTENNYAYLATGYNGLLILDISDPYAPALAGFYDGPTENQTCDIEINGNTAYLANGAGGLCIIDIQDPDNLRLVGSYPTSAGKVGVTASMAAVGDLGFQLIDITEPANPSLLFEYFESRSNSMSVEVNDDYLFVGGFHILDISNIENPICLSSTPVDASDIEIQDTIAYLACGRDGLKILNFADPGAPFLMAHDNNFFDASHICLQNDIAYIADYMNGLKIYDVSNPYEPEYLGFYISPGLRLQYVTVRDSLAYLSFFDFDGGDLFKIVNISDPSSPELISSYYDQWYYPYEAVVRGDLAYVAYGWQFKILDISDPTDPQEISSLEMRAGIAQLACDSEYVYVANGDISAIDITDPYNPREAGYYMTPGESEDICCRDGYIFVAEGTDVLILRLTESGFDDDTDYLPEAFALRQNYPNPFNARTEIQFDLKTASDIRLTVYDILGRKIATLLDSHRPAGFYNIIWDAGDLPSGIYFYKLQAGSFYETKKCLLLK